MNRIRRFPDLPPLWAAALAALAVLAGRLVPPGPFADPFYFYLGLYLVAAGVALMSWAALLFRRRRTPIMPGETPTALIADGPFRFNRNPVYSGMTLVVFGLNFAFGGIVGLALAALFPLVMTRRFVEPEEAALIAAFGEEAERFLTRTRRW